MTAPYRVVCSTEDRPAWLAARVDYIGASEVPIVMGIHHGSWSSRMALYEKKVSGEIDEGGWEENERAYWGRQMEPLLLEEFTKRTGRHVLHVDQMLASTPYPWLSATLDAMQADEHGTKGALELKCTSTYESDWREGKVPEYVYVQIQTQLAVTGLPYAGVAVLFYGNEFQYVTDIERDEKVIEEIAAATKDFYDRIVEGNPPESDASDACRKALRRLYPGTESGKTISLAGEPWLSRDQEREELAERMKVDKKRKQEIENEIRAEIGDESAAELSSGVRYSFTKDRKLQRKAPK